MAEVISLYKQHPLYQEDLDRITQLGDINRLYGKSFMISGATGLIGVCLIDALMHLNKKGANITIYALGRNREKAALRLGEYFEDSNFHFVEREASESLLELPKVDVIIPLASNTHPLAYSKYPIETININVKGAEQALEKALACNAMVLYPSTVEVYGNARGDDDFTEDYTGKLNLATSRACYTESKRLSEALCQSYIAERGAQVKIVRLSRVFGPTMLMSDSKASSQFIQKALAGENIVLKSKGEQLFSYTYVADAVGAMLHVLLHGEEGVAYNPPIVVIHGNQVKDLSDSYKRYLMNYFRKSLDVMGSPIRIQFKEGENPYANKRNTLTPTQMRKRKRLMKHIKKSK